VYSKNGLSDGVHTFTATVTDNAGNISTQTITDKVDTKAPVVSNLNESVSGWTKSTTETITGNATDGAGSGVASVKLYDNGGLVASTTADATTGAFTFAAANLADGSHSFTVVATDNVGNATGKISAGPADKVDTKAPTITSISQGATGAWAASTFDTITVKASDTGAGMASVELYDNGNDVGAATQQKNGSWVLTATGLSDGPNVFTAVAKDGAGNVSTYSPNVTDLVDAVTAPTLGNISETAAGKGKANFSFSVTDIIGGAVGPKIDHFAYWFDGTAGAETSIGANATNVAGLTFPANGKAATPMSTLAIKAARTSMSQRSTYWGISL
jgi:hypothetical protein